MYDYDPHTYLAIASWVFGALAIIEIAMTYIPRTAAKSRLVVINMHAFPLLTVAAIIISFCDADAGRGKAALLLIFLWFVALAYWAGTFAYLAGTGRDEHGSRD